MLPHVPEAPAVPADPVGEVLKENAANGLQIDPQTLKPLWSGETFDPGWAIDVLHPRANPLTDRAEASGTDSAAPSDEERDTEP